MGEENQQKLSLVNRKELEIVGVTEVINYNENKINLDTNQGSMAITGENLHIEHLDLEELKLEVTGCITGLQYEPGSRLTGFFKRLFK